MIRVEIKNDILGNSIFWEGHSNKIGEIRNIVAWNLATWVVQDGKSRNSGMWFVSVVSK